MKAKKRRGLLLPAIRQTDFRPAMLNRVVQTTKDESKEKRDILADFSKDLLII
jgi:hypothetical protein